MGQLKSDCASLLDTAFRFCIFILYTCSLSALGHCIKCLGEGDNQWSCPGHSDTRSHYQRDNYPLSNGVQHTKAKDTRLILNLVSAGGFQAEAMAPMDIVLTADLKLKKTPVYLFKLRTSSFLTFLSYKSGPSSQRHNQNPYSRHPGPETHQSQHPSISCSGDKPWWTVSGVDGEPGWASGKGISRLAVHDSRF